MAMEVCSGCETQFAIGLFRCPRCGVVAPLYASRAHVVISQELPERVSARSMPVLRGEHGPELSGLPQGDRVELSFKQLRAVAKSLGLSAGGTAAELKARIAAAQGGG